MDADVLARQRAAVFERAAASAARMAWGIDELRAHQEQALRSLVAHAKAQSPFHAARLGDVDPARLTLDDLGSLPVMTKREMMSSFDDVVTDRRLTRALVEEHLAGEGDEPRYLLGDHLVTASGGSSGERGLFVLGFDAFVDFALSIMRGTLARLQSFGVTAANPVRGVSVASPSVQHGSRLVSLVAGQGGPLAVTNVPATLPLAEIVARLDAEQPPILVGYPSLIDQLAAEQQAGRLAIHPMAVSCTSELLTSHARARIESAFGAPVASTFASSEGLCGVTAVGDTAITMASDLCIAELVDADDRPVPPGVVSDSVLVTNLTNRLQPLIRYRLEDRMVALPNSANGHLRVEVEGRADDLFAYPGGVVVHPVVWVSALAPFAEVVESQVRQVPGGVEVDLVATAPVDVGAVAAALRGALAVAGLPGGAAVVRQVGELPRNPSTGKARRFVPLQ